MEAEQEKMQFLGLFGVCKHSYKIISSYRKIFSHMTIFNLFLPLSLYFLTRILATQVLFSKTVHDSEDLTQYQNLLDIITDFPSFFLFLLFLSLACTSRVVHTVASFYTSEEETLGFVPEVWKRLVATFLSTALAFFVVNVMAVLVAVLWGLTIGVIRGGVAVSVVIVMVILYLAAWVYLTAVWLLASVVTVLEDSYGFEAMMKSRELMRGKMGLSIMIALKFNVLFLILFLFTMLVVNGWELLGLGWMERTAFAIVCFLLFSQLLVLMLVIKTVMYFICKSYHHEIVDMSAFSDHLGLYQREDCY
ncbi:hypothetical protein Fmac_007639 [Flemingia macrophylla]|uniref:Gustatory receptor n=1 Tax=Flemingia macrophylla TaxID=520843 RepID=A0ABD1MV79_9FABA